MLSERRTENGFMLQYGLHSSCAGMTADVVNYGHWKTGIRVESMIFSSKTAGQKFGGGVAGWLVGCLMDASGFTGLAKEIPSAVEMVKGLYIYGNILAGLRLQS